MLSTKEKEIAEKFIELHKECGGTVSHDKKFNFAQSFSNSFFDINPITSKLIALRLIEYTLSDRTGMTSLTKDGWNFTTFRNHEQMLISQKEIDKITIEKLKLDLRNSKRQARMFWPLTILTLILGFITIFYSIKKPNNSSIKNLEYKVHTTDSVVNSLRDELEQVKQDKNQNMRKNSISE